MNKLHYTRSELTPRIYFDLAKGLIQITGRTSHGNSDDKFEVLVRWVELYCKVPNPTTRVDIELDLISKQTLNTVQQILSLLIDLHRKRITRLNVFWYVDSSHREIHQHIELIEKDLNFRIHRLSPLLT